MSQDFKLRFDEIKQGNPAKPDGATVGKEFFEKNSHVRNICFVWADNKKRFFNYAYLISGEYSPDDSSITLSFTTHTALITGSMLEDLFEDLLSHLPRKIECVEERYRQSMGAGTMIIESITLVAKE